MAYIFLAQILLKQFQIEQKGGDADTSLFLPGRLF